MMLASIEARIVPWKHNAGLCAVKDRNPRNRPPKFGAMKPDVLLGSVSTFLVSQSTYVVGQGTWQLLTTELTTLLVIGQPL